MSSSSVPSGSYDKQIAVAFARKKARNSNFTTKEENEKEKNIFFDYLKRIHDYFLEKYIYEQNYIHCEILFPEVKDQYENCLTFGVFEECGVWKKYRSFNNPEYDYLYLKVNEKEYLKIYNFCADAEKKGQKFDFIGSRISLFWPLRFKNKWWCTTFVVESLQKGANILKYYISTSLTVDDVFNLLYQSKRLMIGEHPNAFNSRNYQTWVDNISSHQTIS